MQAGGHVSRRAAVADRLCAPRWSHLVDQHIRNLRALRDRRQPRPSLFPSSSSRPLQTQEGLHERDLELHGRPTPPYLQRPVSSPNDRQPKWNSRRPLPAPQLFRHSRQLHSEAVQHEIMHEEDHLGGVPNSTGQTEDKKSANWNNDEQYQEDGEEDQPKNWREIFSELRELRNQSGGRRWRKFTSTALKDHLNGRAAKRSIGRQRHLAGRLLGAISHQESDRIEWEDIFTTIRMSTSAVPFGQSVISVRGRVRDLKELDQLEHFKGLRVSHLSLGRMAVSFIYGSNSALREARGFLDQWHALQVFDNLDAIQPASASAYASSDTLINAEQYIHGGMEDNYDPDSSSYSGDLPNESGEWSLATVPPADYSIYEMLYHGSTTIEDVTAELRRFFMEEADDFHVLDYHKIHASMTFLIKHRKLPFARTLLLKMGDLGFPPTIDTYNIFLAGCAADQNLEAWADVHGNMLERNIVPNAETWITVLQLAPDTVSKQRCIRELHRRGYTSDPKINLKMIPLIIPYSLPEYLGAGGDPGKYTNALDRLYGPTWLTRDGLYALLDGFGSKGLYETALNLLQSLTRAYAMRPTRPHMNILLVHLAQQSDLPRALVVLEHLNTHYGFQPDKITYHQLFRLAWVQKSPNILHVVWKYSLYHERQNFQVEARVARSLHTALVRHPFPGTAVGARWAAHAGAIATGRVPNFARRGNLRRAAHGIIAAERASVGRCLPVAPIVDVLLESFERDREWAEAGYRNAKSVRWLVDNIIDVPTRVSRHAQPERLRGGDTTVRKLVMDFHGEEWRAKPPKRRDTDLAVPARGSADLTVPARQGGERAVSSLEKALRDADARIRGAAETTNARDGGANQVDDTGLRVGLLRKQPKHETGS